MNHQNESVVLTGDDKFFIYFFNKYFYIKGAVSETNISLGGFDMRHIGREHHEQKRTSAE